MESMNRLKTNEIRCPYCRNKQTDMLPYYEDMGFEKINGVNFYSPSVSPIKCTHTKYSSSLIKCEYKKKIVYYDTNGEENVSFCNCCNYSSLSKLNEYGDTKHYCDVHKRIVLKKYKMDEAKKIKLEEKAKLKKAKEDLKLEAKEKTKTEMKVKKEDKVKAMKVKVIKEKNVIVSSSIEIQKEDDGQVGCTAILKTGANKGGPCGCSVFEDGLCKRHYNKKPSAYSII
jgi:hypothetical protein